MDTENVLVPDSSDRNSELRRRGEDRRSADERRRGRRRGLFELRALREGLFIDRRRGDRRDEPREATWWGFWRRDPR
jgi:hypothetical protein